ncbi:MAG: transketolase [Gammaproteobacteria bacterium]
MSMRAPGKKKLAGAPSRRELAAAIRALSMDAVQAANSGHPGTPMGMADIAEVLWNDFLRHNPANPSWFDRDRFVMSNGHGCMLLYAVLHLSGYDLSLDEIRHFRQLGSKTPGHPEYGHTPGVETTTGPLGQGLANAVGMAIAEKVMAAYFNRPGHAIVDHYIYVFLGDGCMMEGISHEASSLAGTLGLGKLIAFYDDNGVSIDGDVRGWFTDDTPKRFEAYGWHVVQAVDGHNAAAVKTAIEQARGVTDRPSLICCKTVIGWGAPNKQGTAACHGTALGAEEVALARQRIGWAYAPFEIPQPIYEAWNARAQGAHWETVWRGTLARYRKRYPELASEFERRVAGILPDEWPAHSEGFIRELARRKESVATRNASLDALNAYGPLLPELLGGSADLTGSNLTFWSSCKAVSRDSPDGNYLFYGVREFAMSALMNGIAAHGGFIPYGGTFLVFSDYARNALRLASLMGRQAIFVYTHDSIGLGEDGPTHQAVEQAASLRLMPNMSVWRPCDGVETATAWRYAIERTTGPTSLLLSRQTLPHQLRSEQRTREIQRGGYVLLDCEGIPQVIVIATGSEVGPAIVAAQRLNHDGHRVRVVSMPSTDVFDQQFASYRESVLPSAIRRRVAVEAGISDYWRKYVGLDGVVIGMQSYGLSAPGDLVMAHFGFSAEHIVEALKQLL